MYYLETNALRTLLPKLNQSEFMENSFTSILSLFELAGWIDSQKEFELRKKIISKVRESGIAIDFELPEDRFLKSFGLRVIPDQQQFLINKLNTLLSTEDFSKIDKR